MQDEQDVKAATAAEATDRDSWLERIEEIGEDAGYFEPLGQSHWAFFCDEGTTLLVTFENMEAILARGGNRMPLGHGVAARNGWSHLCLIAEGNTWYRDHRVWGYLDRLVDEAFFEDFDRVVFYGAGMGGYAACAFSVAAPGATVLAISPRATLAPALAGWDRRHLSARGLDFSSRYGYAPDMIDGAGRVYLLHDPAQPMDAMHAALFRKPFVTMLRGTHAGARPDDMLDRLGLLDGLIEAAAAGTLDRAGFARLWRARRNSGAWLKNLSNHLGQSRHPLREALFYRAALGRMGSGRFQRRLDSLTARLEAEGIELPPPLDGPAGD
ncbi:MAG: phosphoadenosine phosphosulfate reductase [Gemmobacter sp.]